MNRHNPWYVKEDSEERNKRARKAYTALLTVTARTPNNEAYRNFSLEVLSIRSNGDLKNIRFQSSETHTYTLLFWEFLSTFFRLLRIKGTRRV
jgi:hypothetical protein